jgi:hypothetical protein
MATQTGLKNIFSKKYLIQAIFDMFNPCRSIKAQELTLQGNIRPLSLKISKPWQAMINP